MISIALLIAFASVAEQMEPARHGKLQCQMPDVAFKTCISLSKVMQTGPSTYRFESRFLINQDGPVVATINATAVVRGEEVCDTIDPSDLSGAIVTTGGKPLPTAKAAGHMARLKRLLAPFYGMESCTRIVIDDQDAAKVESRIEGKRIPRFDYVMKWVDPAEGWTLDPLP
jgi:hypothetical protein